MRWQDVVFGVGNVLLSTSLIPLVLYGTPPPLSTSLLTGGVLGVFAVTFATLRLQFSALALGVTASLWAALLVRGIIEETGL